MAYLVLFKVHRHPYKALAHTLRELLIANPDYVAHIKYLYAQQSGECKSHQDGQ